MKATSGSVLILICTFLLATPIAFCQSNPAPGPPPGLPSGAKLPAVSGTITAINDDGLTIKTPQGESATVKVSTETRFRRDQKEAHLADFKVGDTVAILGEQDTTGTWNARLVALSAPPNPQDIAKHVMFGELTKIEGTKLTVHRPDGVDQTVEVDENTKFLDTHGESIKLADFKIGDHVAGIGAVQNDVFVPREFRKAPTDFSAPPPLPPPPSL